MSFSYSKVIDQYIMAGQLVHTAGVVEPKIFDGFRKLKHIYSQSAVKNMTALAMQVDYFNPPGDRFVPLSFPFSFAPHFRILTGLLR